MVNIQKYVLLLLIVIVFCINAFVSNHNNRKTHIHELLQTRDEVGVSDSYDEHFMRLALRHAQHAFREGEVPIGAALVDDATGRVLSTSRNRVEAKQDPTAHAEICCIQAACEIKENWRLNECTLYTTLEPCPMCMGASMGARVKRVVYGASDPRLGSAGGGFLDIPNMKHPFHKIEITGGVLEVESRQLLTRFFRAQRRKSVETSDTEGEEDSVADFRGYEEEKEGT